MLTIVIQNSYNMCLDNKDLCGGHGKSSVVVSSLSALMVSVVNILQLFLHSCTIKIALIQHVGCIKTKWFASCSWSQSCSFFFPTSMYLN